MILDVVGQSKYLKKNNLLSVITFLCFNVIFAPFTVPLMWVDYFYNKESKVDFSEIVCIILSAGGIIIWLLIAGEIYHA
jgi:O-antigen/teichoic acid export membrane protein